MDSFSQSYLRKGVRILLLFLVSLSGTQILSAQCNTDELLDRCSPDLGTYNYIKTFTAPAKQKKNSTADNPYIFSTGSVYKLIACNGEPEEGRMIISLYDRNHNLLASTYNTESKKHYSEIQYPCRKTGVYYIRISFDSPKNGCGICILGFSKDI